MALAVAPEVPVVGSVHVEIVAALDALPISDAVDVEHPAALGRVVEVP